MLSEIALLFIFLHHSLESSRPQRLAPGPRSATDLQPLIQTSGQHQTLFDTICNIGSDYNYSINCFSIGFGFCQSCRLCQAVVLDHLVGWCWLVDRWVDQLVSLIGWLVWLVGQLLVQLVVAFDIVLAIIFLSGSRRNHSLKQSHIYIGPLLGLSLLFGDPLDLLGFYPFNHHLLVQCYKVALSTSRPLLHFFSRGLPYLCSKRLMDKLMLTSQESGFTTSSRLCFSSLFCTVAPTKAFNRAKDFLYRSTNKTRSSFHL